jgi:hypothetical protein
MLKSIGWDMSNIEYNNKEVRNIQIGLLQRDNPKLSKFIMDNTRQLIDFYIEENKLENIDVVIRQRDGIITKKKLSVTNITMPIELRGIISHLIISMTRKEWLIIYNDGKIDVKGIKDKPVDISFYELFSHIDFLSQKNVITSIDNIRTQILTSKNIWWFTKKDGDEFVVPFFREGIMRFPRSTVLSVDIGDVEKLFIWEEYVWPFAQSLLIECMERNLC